jgi:hypothetical protein
VAPDSPPPSADPSSSAAGSAAGGSAADSRTAVQPFGEDASDTAGGSAGGSPGSAPFASRERLKQLGEQVSQRLEEPTRQPPAWQMFLCGAYEFWPPRTWTRAQCTAEIEGVLTVPPMSVGVIKALRRALTVYHPDKNRLEAYGTEWAHAAEELAKIASFLLEHYRRRVAQATS